MHRRAQRPVREPVDSLEAPMRFRARADAVPWLADTSATIFARPPAQPRGAFTEMKQAANNSATAVTAAPGAGYSTPGSGQPNEVEGNRNLEAQQDRRCDPRRARCRRGGVTSSAMAQSGSLVGAGSTLVAPLMAKWSLDFQSKNNIGVTYGAVGSGTGIAQITARTVDFGASDAPLTPDQAAACNSCVQIPWALSRHRHRLPRGGDQAAAPDAEADRRHLHRQGPQLERPPDRGGQQGRRRCRTCRSRPCTAVTARVTRTRSPTTCRAPTRRGRAASASAPRSASRRASAAAATTA